MSASDTESNNENIENNEYEINEYEIKDNKIRFIRNFNKPLESYLELIKECDEVWFVRSFNQSIDILPDTIKSITIDNPNYNISITKFPSNLEYFEFHAEFYEFPNDKMFEFPKTLKHLGWYCYGCENVEVKISDLPNYIESLELGIEFECNELNHFNNLKKLSINIEDFNDRLDCLPSGLEELNIYSENFNQPLDNLPLSLKVLDIGNNMECEHEYSLDNLPLSLEKLILPDNYNGSLDNLPINLKYLVIGYNYNGSINNLPDSIEIIEWISILDYKKKIIKLPKNLKEVIYGNDDEIRNAEKKIRCKLLRNTKIKLTEYSQLI